MKHFRLIRIILLLLIPVLYSTSLAAQAPRVLSLDSAISILLKTNYNILMARDNAEVAKNNHAPGTAGMLPFIGISGGYNGSNNQIEQIYSSGIQIKKDNVVSTYITPTIGLTWTLFDGTKMFVAYNQSGVLRDQAMLNLKAAVQDNVASVISGYYNIVQHKKMLIVMDSTLAYYKISMDITRNQFEVGTTSKLNYLQAKVAYNAERSAYLREEVNLSNAIVALNQLLAMPPETSYEVTDTIPLRRDLAYENLKKSMLSANPALEVSRLNMKVAENNRREVQALHLPVITFGLNYGLSQTRSNAGFTLLNRSLGFSGGLGFSWTLFNGGVIHIQEENAEIQEMNAKIQFNQAEEVAEANLLNAFRQYENSLRILKMDEENFDAARETVTIALAQFKVGTIAIIQLQQAQTSYETAGSQMVIDKYNAKQSETLLLQTAGLLAK